MRVVDELGASSEEEVASVVITGDGRAEYRRLQPIADRFNEEKVLFFPSRPDRHLSTIVGRRSETSYTGKPGFEALDGLLALKSHYPFSRFLFLVDREHINNDSAEELETKVKEIAQEDEIDITELDDRAFRCGFHIGSREITLFAAIIGDEFGCFEDGIATLLERRWENSINPESRDELKGKVTDILGDSGLESLVDSCQRSDLKHSFPNLCAVLAEYE